MREVHVDYLLSGIHPLDVDLVVIQYKAGHGNEKGHQVGGSPAYHVHVKGLGAFVYPRENIAGLDAPRRDSQAFYAAALELGSALRIGIGADSAGGLPRAIVGRVQPHGSEKQGIVAQVLHLHPDRLDIFPVKVGTENSLGLFSARYRRSDRQVPLALAVQPIIGGRSLLTLEQLPSLVGNSRRHFRQKQAERYCEKTADGLFLHCPASLRTYSRP